MKKPEKPAAKPAAAKPVKSSQVDESSIEGLVDINLERLDLEWQRQASLMLKFSLQLSDAELAYNEAKNEVEYQKAYISNDIRKNPEFYDLEKTTEGSIEAAMKVQKAYMDALVRLNNAEKACSVLKAATRALDHKKKALESLVFLRAQGYFAEPKLKGGSVERELHENALKQSARNIAGKD